MQKKIDCLLAYIFFFKFCIKIYWTNFFNVFFTKSLKAYEEENDNKFCLHHHYLKFELFEIFISFHHMLLNFIIWNCIMIFILINFILICRWKTSLFSDCAVHRWSLPSMEPCQDQQLMLERVTLLSFMYSTNHHTILLFIGNVFLSLPSIKILEKYIMYTMVWIQEIILLTSPPVKRFLYFYILLHIHACSIMLTFLTMLYMIIILTEFSFYKSYIQYIVHVI